MHSKRRLRTASLAPTPRSLAAAASARLSLPAAPIGEEALLLALRPHAEVRHVHLDALRPDGLRLELSARQLAIWELRVGTPTLAGKFTISFQDVAANAEGGGASGNPFEDFEDTKEDKEDHTEKLLAKMDAAIGGGLFARPPTNDSPIVSFSSPGSKTPSTVAADDNGVKSDVKELMSAMRALQAEQKALAKQLARIVDKKQVHVSATVLGQ